MTDLKENNMAPIAALPTTVTLRSSWTTVARWMVSFAGFPLGGVTAMILTGPVNSTASAIAGGFVAGVVLGAVQAWALRADRRLFAAWALATAVGLASGLAAGASLVRFSTDLGDLAIQGAVSGAAVGLAQAIALWRRTGPIALAWPLCLAGAWTVGWVVTASIGVKVDQQFTVFGSAGAVCVALLTSALPLFHNTGTATEKSSS
jgi:hypothetical protein